MKEWIRVSKRNRCPICDHADWCLISADGTSVICPRVESEHAVGDAGWLHRLDENHVRPPRRSVFKPRPILPTGNLTAMACRFQDAGDRLGKIAETGERLNLATESLMRFGVGWSFREDCSTWPMCNAKGQIVGITRRFGNGKKKVMSGHKAGIYMPADLPEDMSNPSLPLLVCEGGSDAVTGLDLGFWSVGRFSCTHGAKLLVNFVRHRCPSLVVIVKDADGPGHRGAESLASTLLPYLVSLKVITPPAPYKDLRAWRLAGGGAAELETMIRSMPLRRLAVKVRTA
jgi:hypothetical protein